MYQYQLIKLVKNLVLKNPGKIPGQIYLPSGQADGSEFQDPTDYNQLSTSLLSFCVLSTP